MDIKDSFTDMFHIVKPIDNFDNEEFKRLHNFKDIVVICTTSKKILQNLQKYLDLFTILPSLSVDILKGVIRMLDYYVRCWCVFVLYL